MKRSLILLMAALYMLCICGCSKKDGSQPEHSTLATNEAAVTDISDGETSENDNEASGGTGTSDEALESGLQAQETDPDGSPQAGTEAPFSVSVPQTTTRAAGTKPSLDTEGTQPAEGIYGAEGRTEAEWLAFAQELYMEGCDLSFRYLCTGSEFPFDTDDLEIIDKTYFLTTCASFDEATAPYYELFSREYHGNDFDGLLLEQNGRLYAARAARGMDMTYLSSEVKELVSVSDTEIAFSVLVQYEDSEITAEFTLVPEDGVWKIGKFTLPY